MTEGINRPAYIDVVTYRDDVGIFSETHSVDGIINSASELLNKPEYARTFFLGFDLKKTPSGKWFIIEVNGRRSGLGGLESVHEGFSQDGFEQDVRTKYGMAKTLHSHLLQAELSKWVEDPSKETELKDPEVERQIKMMSRAIASVLQFNDEDFEEFIHGKVQHKTILPSEHVVPYKYLDVGVVLSDIKSWVGDFAQDTPEDFNGNYVVVKKPRSSLGLDVNVYRLSKLKLQDLQEGYIVEPFVRSIGIINETTDTMHDGCMRFGVFANVGAEGEVEFTYPGGYWRLSPRPVDEKKSGLKKRFTANFSRGAKAHCATDDQLQEAQQIVEEATIVMLTNYYGRQFKKKDSFTPNPF